MAVKSKVVPTPLVNPSVVKVNTFCVVALLAWRVKEVSEAVSKLMVSASCAASIQSVQVILPERLPYMVPSTSRLPSM